MGGDPNAKVYTLNEVSKHNKENDCWVIIYGKVYDVSSYLEEHPGGDEVLLSATGKDATDDFEDAGHSASARETMEEYYIGEIDPSTVSMKSTFEQTHYNPDKTFEIMMKILQFAAPVVFLGLVAAFRFYTKKK